MRTTVTLKIAATAAAIAAATGIALAAPATAETQTYRDARGDVRATRVETAAAPRADIDIVRATNTYRGRTLTVALAFDGLQRNNYGAQWLLRTPESQFLLLLDKTQAGPPTIGFFEFSGPPVRFAPGTVSPGAPPICEGVEIDRKGATLVGSVPRSCLEGADEVRVAAVSVEPQDQPGRFRADDARRKGLAGDPQDPRFGPVLERN